MFAPLNPVPICYGDHSEASRTAAMYPGSVDAAEGFVVGRVRHQYLVAVKHTELTGQCPGQFPSQETLGMIPAQVITQHAWVPDCHCPNLGRVRNLGSVRSPTQIPKIVVSMVYINKDLTVPDMCCRSRGGHRQAQAIYGRVAGVIDDRRVRLQGMIFEQTDLSDLCGVTANK